MAAILRSGPTSEGGPALLAAWRRVAAFLDRAGVVRVQRETAEDAILSMWRRSLEVWPEPWRRQPFDSAVQVTRAPTTFSTPPTVAAYAASGVSKMATPERSKDCLPKTNLSTLSALPRVLHDLHVSEPRKRKRDECIDGTVGRPQCTARRALF